MLNKYVLVHVSIRIQNVDQNISLSWRYVYLKSIKNTATRYLNPCNSLNQNSVIITILDHRTLIATKVSRHHYLVPKAGGKFDAKEFDEHPERYRSIFSEKIAPYANVIINGVYWAPENPRLITDQDALSLLEIKNRPDKYGGCPELPHRLLALCDISADLGGSIEFVKDTTTIEYPFEMYDAKTDKADIGVVGDGVMICSIDNIPAQLPREATDFFGHLLKPWIPEMVLGDATRPLDEETCYSPTIRRGIITSNGALTPDYKYIATLRA